MEFNSWEMLGRSNQKIWGVFLSHGADDLRRILLSSETFAEIDLFPGGTIGLPLEMGWDASRLFADEANIVAWLSQAGGIMDVHPSRFMENPRCWSMPIFLEYLGAIGWKNARKPRGFCLPGLPALFHGEVLQQRWQSPVLGRRQRLLAIMARYGARNTQELDGQLMAMAPVPLGFLNGWWLFFWWSHQGQRWWILHGILDVEKK